MQQMGAGKEVDIIKQALMLHCWNNPSASR